MAIGMAAFGLGLVVSINVIGDGLLAAIFGIGVLACVVAAIGLAVEYLIRAWIQRPSRKLAPYQFTLAGMFILTTAVAVICACFKILGPVAIVWMILAMLVVACLVESIQRRRAGNGRR